MIQHQKEREEGAESFVEVVPPPKYSAGRTKALARPLKEAKVGGWEIWAVWNKAVAAEGLWLSFMNSNLV